MDVSKHILVIDTSILAKSNMGRRGYRRAALYVTEKKKKQLERPEPRGVCLRGLYSTGRLLDEPTGLLGSVCRWTVVVACVAARNRGGGDVRDDTIRSDPITAKCSLIEATLRSSATHSAPARPALSFFCWVLPYLPLTFAPTYFFFDSIL
jgi:hypothetical protein